MKLRNAVCGMMAAAAVAAIAPAPLMAQGPPPPGYQGPPPGYAPQPWEAPPSEYQEVQQRGFHDGVEGARKDYQNHRQPNVNNRDEYRHPNVPKHDREAYREAFQRGYRVGVQHIWNGGR
jgi:ribosome modulation factor